MPSWRSPAVLAPSVLAGALLLLVLDGVSRSEPRANVVIAGPTPTAPNPRAAESVVVHIKGHQALRHNFVGVHQNFTAVCDDACLRATLSFDVASLKDLCGRGTISRSYSKCKLVM